jgi:hypothetical protein
MLRDRKKSAIWSAVIVIVAAIVTLSFKQADYPYFVGQRISDNYQRGLVKSYEVFQVDIEGHALMMVRLKTGERFPMLCRVTSNGIAAMPQSVFIEAEADRWSIMCEPHIRQFSVLMMLKLSRVDGEVFVDGSRLERFATPPLLL